MPRLGHTIDYTIYNKKKGEKLQVELRELYDIYKRKTEKSKPKRIYTQP